MSTAAFYSGDSEDGPFGFISEPWDMTSLAEETEVNEKWIMFYADRIVWQAEQELIRACSEES
jgi:hypothetical protein